MLFKYELQIIDTGETIFSEYSDRSMVGWQKITERRLLRDGRRSEAIKTAIKNCNTIVGWANYDEIGYVAKVFQGYDTFFESRTQTN